MNAMIFELWDTETNNIVGAYESEDAALAAVQATLRAQGVRAVETLLLGREDDAGESALIAQGHDLVKLAERLSLR